MSLIAQTPKPPYYAVIFTSTQTDELEGYAEMAARMETLAKEQPGYLGFEAARNDIGIAVSYWRDLESIRLWKADVEHMTAQSAGRERWYSEYVTRICLVERDYAFSDNKS